MTGEARHAKPALTVLQRMAGAAAAWN